jgi:hypothetical protein
MSIFIQPIRVVLRIVDYDEISPPSALDILFLTGYHEISSILIKDDPNCRDLFRVRNLIPAVVVKHTALSFLPVDRVAVDVMSAGRVEHGVCIAVQTGRSAPAQSADDLSGGAGCGHTEVMRIAGADDDGLAYECWSSGTGCCQGSV